MLFIVILFKTNLISSKIRQYSHALCGGGGGGVCVSWWWWGGGGLDMTRRRIRTYSS